MISKGFKIVTGIQKLKAPIKLDHGIVQRCRHALYKGYEPHYQWFNNHLQDYNQKDQFYCFDKASVDLALQMAHRRVRQLTYCSTRNYETVMALSKNPLNQQETQAQKELFPKAKPTNIQKKCDNIDIKTSKAALHILSNYKFIIKSGYLDVHPLEAYQKMCGYLNIKPGPNYLNLFNSFQCSQKVLFDGFVLIPILAEMRQTFLVTEGRKLKRLQRKQGVQITPATIDNYMDRWTKTVDLSIAQNAYSTFSEQAKLKWAIDNSLGIPVSKNQLIQGKYRHYYYATWN